MTTTTTYYSGTPSPESEMQANLPHDLTAPPTYEYSSTFSRVACRQAREGDVSTERTGIPRNSRLTEFVVRASAVCMQQTAIQSDSSRFRCTCCPRGTACAWDCAWFFSSFSIFSETARSLARRTSSGTRRRKPLRMHEGNACARERYYG